MVEAWSDDGKTSINIFHYYCIMKIDLLRISWAINQIITIQTFCMQVLGKWCEVRIYESTIDNIDK